jgi:hypothetical protein
MVPFQSLVHRPIFHMCKCSRLWLDLPSHAQGILFVFCSEPIFAISLEIQRTRLKGNICYWYSVLLCIPSMNNNILKLLLWTVLEKMDLGILDSQQGFWLSFRDLSLNKLSGGLPSNLSSNLVTVYVICLLSLACSLLHYFKAWC